jgi:hypothetical protein
MERESSLEPLPRGERLHRRARHVFSGGSARLVALRGASWVLGSLGLWDPARHFAPFPNYHVRTNAFMALRATLTRIRLGPIFTKLSAFMFESGRNGFTSQILGLGLRPVLVGRDGRAYEKEDWHLANTFRQGRQENLIVADNQTDAYADADLDARAELSRLAWGRHARPA